MLIALLNCPKPCLTGVMQSGGLECPCASSWLGVTGASPQLGDRSTAVLFVLLHRTSTIRNVCCCSQTRRNVGRLHVLTVHAGWGRTQAAPLDRCLAQGVEAVAAPRERRLDTAVDASWRQLPWEGLIDQWRRRCSARVYGAEGPASVSSPPQVPARRIPVSSLKWYRLP